MKDVIVINEKNQFSYIKANEDSLPDNLFLIFPVRENSDYKTLPNGIEVKIKPSGYNEVTLLYQGVFLHHALVRSAIEFTSLLNTYTNLSIKELNELKTSMTEKKLNTEIENLEVKKKELESKVTKLKEILETTITEFNEKIAQLDS